jgi:hypothetical protein
LIGLVTLRQSETSRPPATWLPVGKQINRYNLAAFPSQ